MNKQNFSLNKLPRAEARGIFFLARFGSHPRFENRGIPAQNKHFDVSIILPVYNEGENISKQIRELERKISYDHEILIVYDFEQDSTVPYIKKLQIKYKALKGVKNIFGRGVINAVKTGFKKSSGDAVVVMPADLADDPETINRMFKKILDGFDIVCATRYAKGGKKMGGGILKTTLSRMAGIMTPLLLGIPTTDIANGFKMYRKQVLEKIEIESRGGWEFSMEIVIKAHKAGFKVCDVPTVWRDRISGKSKFKLLKWLPFYLKWYLLGISYRFPRA